MSRSWVSQTDRRWYMRCDQKDCTTRSEVRLAPEGLDLRAFADAGWYIGQKIDLCPACVLDRGGISEILVLDDEDSGFFDLPHEVTIAAWCDPRNVAHELRGEIRR